MRFYNYGFANNQKLIAEKQSLYAQKIQEQKGKESKVYYRTYSLVSIPEDTYKDLLEVDNYDYIYQSEIYVTRLRVLMNYASTLYNEHPDFRVLLNCQ